jgi:hypothetical protein
MDETHSNRRVIVVLLVMLLPVVYVLSSGPAVYLYDRSGASTQRVFEFVYYPIDALPMSSIPERLLTRYIELWR